MKEDTIFINRELSWLDFNRRVLVLGKDKNVPLAEQVKFLAIYGSNLDEFFMVRVGSLQERANLARSQKDKDKRENKTNMTAEEQLNAIMPKVAHLQEDCDKYYEKALENLDACGYKKVNFDAMDKEQERFWKKYFQNELFPILSPQIVDNRHPFPFLRNKEIYLGALLKEKEGQSLGMIPISSQMERLILVRREGKTEFALTEELVLHYASLIFGKDAVQEKCLFRVTRNADIDVKEGMMDHDIDYREIMADLLKRRRKLAAVRLQVTPTAPQEILRLLCDKLELSHKRVFAQKSPLDLSFFYKLTGKMEAEGNPELFYPTARPMLPPQDYDLAAEVEKHDVLLSYPYQSIRPFIAMLKKAARDPEVISIKMTLYRMARESQIVQALIEAAENGKEVVALVELRARFDEQNNIDWSKQLEEAGCTILYGFDDYKVHSKLTLITKKSAHGYSYITQIGTGNYNEKTSELYTDYSFITADLGIGEEASNVFQNLAVQKLTEESEKMLVAPLRFKSVLLDEMDRVINAARLGRPASMILKNNSISDRDIILKLEEASWCRSSRLTAGMMAAVSSCLPVKCSVANTACATSISKPPAAVTSQSSARSKSSVRKGLYTTSSTASSAGNAFGSIRHCPTFGNMPQGVVLTMICTSGRCMASLYSRASPLPVRLAVRISLAPPSRQTAVTVECVPPVPRISTVLPAKSTPWAPAR